MMSRATLPISFWGYALETAAHILNLVPTKKVSKTPFEKWKGKRPSLGHIKIWGCEDNVVFVAQRGVLLEREMISKEDSGRWYDDDDDDGGGVACVGGGSDCGGRLWLPEGGGGTWWWGSDRSGKDLSFHNLGLAGKTRRKSFPAATTWWWPDSGGEGERKKMSCDLDSLIIRNERHNGNVILNVGSSNELDKSKLWRSRLGHINKKRITQLQKDGVLESFDFKSDDVCESCLLGKMIKSPFTGSCERGEGLLDLVHTDVCGPFRSTTKDGNRYYVTFTDDFSRYEYVYLIKHKSDTFEVFKKYQNEVESQLGKKIKSVDEEPIVNIDTQPEVVTPVEPDDISLPIRRISGRVRKPPQFYYGFHIEEDKISDSTLRRYIKIVGCKWIFKKKTDMDGKVHTYKARLVAKGYTQTHRIDYEETFSPVAKIKSIRIMLAIAAFHDYEIWHMDVKTAFLNGKLTEDLFMVEPEGFENEKYPKRMCKLQTATYGLKQASRSWNLCFLEKFTRFGFSRSEDESCIYVKVSGSVIVFLVLYVDDILLIGNDIPTLQIVKDWLGKCFAMKDLGDAAYNRDRSKRLIGLSQDMYLDKNLKRFKIENSKKGNLPLHHGIKIRSIMYAMTCTRPDVSFGLSMVSRHQQNPGERHWTAIKNILNWQTDKDDSFSQSGWVFLLNRGAVTWKSSKQDTVNFIGDLRVVPTVQDPVEIFCNNKSAVALTKEPKDHIKSKHIERKYHFVRSKVEGHVIVKHMQSEDNPADPFTKALAKSGHDEHDRSIGLKDNIKF
ncbi:retrotransposon protein, putative, ty1-copia subclass [Tanacetum coccineum]